MNQESNLFDDLNGQLPDEEEKDIINGAFARHHTHCPDIDKEWEKLKALTEGETKQTTNHFARTLQILLVAAACIAAVFLLWPTTIKDDSRQVISYEKQATNRITMTTDGETRPLSQDCMSFNQTADPKHNVDYEIVAIKTPRGKECHLTLADGTKVWLNGESILEFPQRFTGRQREVKLEGEAYFEVAKDHRHPFIVKSRYYTATVLGTSFNATAYSERNAGIALVEGQVKVNCGQDQQELILHPGNLLTLTNDKSFKLTQVDTYPYTQRKEGLFYYDNTTLRNIMLDMGRWYNKTVVFENEEYMDMRLHFVAERKENMTDVLRDLSDLAGVDIHISEHELVIR